MPAAIDRDVLMACHVCKRQGSESLVRMANVNPAKFPAEEVTYAPGSEGPVLDQKAHSWVNYFKVCPNIHW